MDSQTNKEIQKHIDAAYKIAFKALHEHLQEMFLMNRKKIDEILVTMGTVAFYKGDDPLWNHESEKLKGYKKLDSFLDKWDDTLCLRGGYIHITDGKIELK